MFQEMHLGIHNHRIYLGGGGRTQKLQLTFFAVKRKNFFSIKVYQNSVRVRRGLFAS